MQDPRLLFILLLVSVNNHKVMANLSDNDSMDSETGGQMDGGDDGGSDYTDPNINTPEGGHMGFADGSLNPTFTDDKDSKGKKDIQPGSSNLQRPPTTVSTQTEDKVDMLQMTVTAIMQLGMIVGVAFLCGSLFMMMVGLEILSDKASEKYRQVFHKPEPVPDIERLHPAELVGTFSRYK